MWPCLPGSGLWVPCPNGPPPSPAPLRVPTRQNPSPSPRPRPGPNPNPSHRPGLNGIPSPCHSSASRQRGVVSLSGCRRARKSYPPPSQIQEHYLKLRVAEWRTPLRSLSREEAKRVEAHPIMRPLNSQRHSTDLCGLGEFFGINSD